MFEMVELVVKSCLGGDNLPHMFRHLQFSALNATLVVL